MTGRTVKALDFLYGFDAPEAAVSGTERSCGGLMQPSLYLCGLRYSITPSAVPLYSSKKSSAVFFMVRWTLPSSVKRKMASKLPK